MHYQQNRCFPWLDGDCPDCMPALFSDLIHPVQANEAILILKHQGRQLE